MEGLLDILSSTLPVRQAPVVAGAIFFSFGLTMGPLYLLSKLSLKWKLVYYEVYPSLLIFGVMTLYFWWYMLLPIVGGEVIYEWEFRHPIWRHGYTKLYPFEEIIRKEREYNMITDPFMDPYGKGILPGRDTWGLWGWANVRPGLLEQLLVEHKYYPLFGEYAKPGGDLAYGFYWYQDVYGYRTMLAKLYVAPQYGLVRFLMTTWFYFSFPFQRDVLVLIYWIMRAKLADYSAWFPW